MRRTIVGISGNIIIVLRRGASVLLITFTDKTDGLSELNLRKAGLRYPATVRDMPAER